MLMQPENLITSGSIPADAVMAGDYSFAVTPLVWDENRAETPFGAIVVERGDNHPLTGEAWASWYREGGEFRDGMAAYSGGNRASDLAQARVRAELQYKMAIYSTVRIGA